MWSKLDDGILDNPKVAKVGLLGFGWYAAGLIYCNRNLTDGFIPWNIARTLIPLEHVEPETERVLEASEVCGMAGWSGQELGEMLCTRLCAAGLWHEVSGGYYVHDFLDWNPPKEKVLVAREAARERMKKHRSGEVQERSDEVRPKFNFPVPVPVPVVQEHITPPVPPLRRRTANRTALQMAQDATTTALGEASVRLVTAASERFSWTLTKTRLAEEWRLAGELLEHWDEATILRAIAQRRKLGSMRWLADFIPQMLAQPDPPPKQRAWLDDIETPEPDLTPEQRAANQVRVREMVSTALKSLPR